SWAVVHSVSATFMCVLQYLAEKETTRLHTTPEQSIQEDDACSCRFPEEEQGEYQVHGKSTEFRDLLVD
uniref:Uncharacterized protein n=1 Tax=Calidris pygmaea TaxID=425635 RepID=A0A8C3K013_9CHAR